MGIQSADWIEEHEEIVNKKFKRLKMVITILKNITIQIFSIARKNFKQLLCSSPTS